jgi:hypothetical protein
MQVEAAKRREEARRALFDKLGLPYVEAIPDMDIDEMTRRVGHTFNVFPTNYFAVA